MDVIGVHVIGSGMAITTVTATAPAEVQADFVQLGPLAARVVACATKRGMCPGCVWPVNVLTGAVISGRKYTVVQTGHKPESGTSGPLCRR
jgi:hypothetical protein